MQHSGNALLRDMVYNYTSLQEMKTVLS